MRSMVEGLLLNGDDEEARSASQLARVALIVSAMALALAVLGLFLPIG